MGNYLAERGTGGTELPLVCHTIRSTAARQRAALLQDKFELGRPGEVMSHTGSKIGSGASFDIFPLFEGVSSLHAMGHQYSAVFRNSLFHHPSFLRDVIGSD